MNKKEFFGTSIPELQRAVDDWRRAGEFDVLYSTSAPPVSPDNAGRFGLAVYYRPFASRWPRTVGLPMVKNERSVIVGRRS